MSDLMTPEEFVHKYNMKVSYIKYLEPVVTTYEHFGQTRENTSYKFRFQLTGYNREFDYEESDNNAVEPITLGDTYEVEWTYTVGVGILLDDKNGEPLPGTTFWNKEWVGKKDMRAYLNAWGKKYHYQREALDGFVRLRTETEKWLFQPKILDILWSLYMDFESVENSRNFEDWASAFGYDSDSRKAEMIYKTIIAQAKEFKWTFGEAVYKDLLNNTDWSEY